jgi:hypothetical protein
VAVEVVAGSVVAHGDAAAFAVHAHDAMAVFLAKVADVGAGDFEDPQPEQTEHGDQSEVVDVGRISGGGQQRLEL